MKRFLLTLLFVGLVFGLVKFLLISEMGLGETLISFVVGISVIWLGFKFSSSVSE